jgi:DNA-binding MarR family transcriptional regulator
MCPSLFKPATGGDPKPEALAKRFLDSFRLIHIADSKTIDESLAIMNESGLTVPQLIALQVLRFEGTQSVGEIADRTHLSRPATSHLVDRLVVMGLVVRVEDENDRRQKQVSLSPKGLGLVEQVVEGRIAHVATGLKALSPETRARLYDVLAEVARELTHLAPSCRGAQESE